jgi:hypothetical protein
MGIENTEKEWYNVGIGMRGASNAALFTQAYKNLRRYRFCISSGGSFLMAPPSTRTGDIVCVLFSCDMPVVLRKRAKENYVFLGECYAHGIMEGEAMKDFVNGKYSVEELHIY